MKILILFVPLLFFTACPSKIKSKLGYGLKLSETLRINLSTEPPTLDWNKSTDTTSGSVQINLMEGLVQYNLNDPELSLKPGLAVSWFSMNQAKTWVFNLRKGVKWTDGVSFKAGQVIDSWERLLNPKTASAYAYFLYGIKNARKYNEGKIKDFSEVGAKVNEKGQVVVNLEGSQTYFPSLLTHQSTFPIRKDLIAQYGNKWTDAGKLITLGTYTLKIWDHNKAIVLERNDSYYGKKAMIKYILAYMVSEPSTAIALFDSGKLDIQSSLPSIEIPILKKRKEYSEKNNLSIYYYGFNTKKAPFDNVNMRKAFSMAIDRREITKLMNDQNSEMTSWVPRGMFGHESSIGIKFNSAEAKKFLVRAGYGKNKKIPKITLAFNTSEGHQRIAENVQAQIKRNLGISIELRNEEWKVYLSSLRADPPQIYRMGWLADYPDPDNFLNLMTSYSENNHTGWVNKEFDKLIESGVSEKDPSQRKSIYSKAQRILTEQDVPVIPIKLGMSRFLISDRVKNFKLNSMSLYMYKNVTLK